MKKSELEKQLNQLVFRNGTPLPEYWKLRSRDTYEMIYVMFDSENSILIEVLVQRMNKPITEWTAKIIEMKDGYKAPYLFRNMFILPEEEYEVATAIDFKIVYDLAFNRFRSYCI